MEDSLLNKGTTDQDHETKVAKEQHKQLVRAYQDIFLSSAEGQLVLWDLLNLCYVFRRYGGCNATAYHLEGKRELGLHLLEMIQFSDKLGGPGPAKMQEIINSLIVAGKVQYRPDKKEDAKDE